MNKYIAKKDYIRRNTIYIYSIIKNIFTFKNLLLFIILFLLFWILYKELLILINTNGISKEEIESSYWKLKTPLLGIYITFLINYIYIYLKKNSFSEFKTSKNIFIDGLIVLFLSVIFWIILYFIMSKNVEIYRNKNIYMEPYFWKIQLYIFFIMFFSAFSSLFLLSFLFKVFKNIKNRIAFYYVFLMLIVILQVIIIIDFKPIFALNLKDTVNRFFLIAKILGLITIFLLILNIATMFIRKKI